MPTADSSSPAPASQFSSRERLVNNWIDRKASLIVLLVIAVAAWLQIRAALPSYLNPDEAYNFLASCLPSIGEAWRVNMRNPHPPLYNVVLLYLWCKLGTSDFWLRLSSILAGIAAIWLAWLWLKRLFNRPAAVAGVIVLAFTPEVIAMAAEVRDYALLLLLAFAGLYFLERALETESIGDMLFSGLLFWLALLTHYSAVILLLPIAGYALFELVRRRLGRKLVLAWALGQAGLVAIFGWLYLTHIRFLQSIGREEAAREFWLRSSYFHPETGDRLVSFVVSRTIYFFQYLFAGQVAGYIGLGLFLGGVLLLVLFGQGQNRRRTPVLLLLLPLLVAAGAAVARRYPYGGTRHDLILAVPVVAGVAALYYRLSRERIWPALAIGLVAVPVWLATAGQPSQSIAPKNQRRELMQAAVEKVLELTPSDGLIFTDKQGEQLLRRYINRTGVIAYDTLPGRVLRCRVGGRSTALVFGIWAMSADSFGPCLERVVQACQHPSQRPVTVFWAGWGWNLLRELGARGRRFAVNYEFGDNICLFLVPGTLTQPSSELTELVRTAATRLSGQCRYVVWPDRLLAAAGSVSKLPAIGYRRFYTFLRDDPGAVLPALAVWEVGNSESHPVAARYMDEAEHYVSGGLRFTLLGSVSDGSVLIYFVEQLQP